MTNLFQVMCGGAERFLDHSCSDTSRKEPRLLRQSTPVFLSRNDSSRNGTQFGCCCAVCSYSLHT
eukprot:6026625-Amphidinium_carterae.1